MDDVAKAAEAVRRWLEGLCDQCTDMEYCEFCRLDGLKYETKLLEDLVRAVLDALEQAIAMREAEGLAEGLAQVR